MKSRRRSGTEPGDSERPIALDLEPQEIRERLAARGVLGDAPRLAEQAARGLLQDFAPSFAEVPRLAPWKARVLEEAFDHRPLAEAEVRRAADGSTHFAFRLEDGAVVESVLIPRHGRLSVCLSSQAGCALACRFCATGLLGLRRNLAVHEIVGQYAAVARHAGRRMSDLVFMGMGEPLQNEAAVLKSCRILAHAFGPQVSPRRMMISTAGVVPAIRRFAAARHRMKLVFSLGSAVPEKRARLMPIQRTYGFDALLDAIREYQGSIGGKHVTLEYIAIRGLTLGDDDVDALRENLRDLRFILNVIPFNPVGSELEAPTLDEVRAWTERLRPLGFPIKIRYSWGRDAGAGCGQLGLRLAAAGG